MASSSIIGRKSPLYGCPLASRGPKKQDSRVVIRIVYYRCRTAVEPSLPQPPLSRPLPPALTGREGAFLNLFVFLPLSRCAGGGRGREVRACGGRPPTLPRKLRYAIPSRGFGASVPPHPRRRPD